MSVLWLLVALPLCSHVTAVKQNEKKNKAVELDRTRDEFQPSLRQSSLTQQVANRSLELTGSPPGAGITINGQPVEGGNMKMKKTTTFTQNGQTSTTVENTENGKTTVTKNGVVQGSSTGTGAGAGPGPGAGSSGGALRPAAKTAQAGDAPCTGSLCVSVKANVHVGSGCGLGSAIAALRNNPAADCSSTRAVFGCYDGNGSGALESGETGSVTGDLASMGVERSAGNAAAQAADADKDGKLAPCEFHGLLVHVAVNVHVKVSY